MRKILLRFTITITLVLVCFCQGASAAADWTLVEPQPPLSERIRVEHFAKNDLTELLEVSHAEANLLHPVAQYGYIEDYPGGKEPVWVVCFYDADNKVKYKVMRGSQGVPIDRVIGDGDFTYAHGIDTAREGVNIDLLSYGDADFPVISDLYNQEGEYYYYWSLEEKAAFSEKWLAKLDEYQSLNPDDEFLKDNIIWIYTRFVNGIPGNDVLTMDEAFRRAAEVVYNDGGKHESAPYLVGFYDVTSPESPFWRLYFDLRYSVAVDANTGEILFVKDADPNTYDLSEFLLETNIR